MEHVYTKDPTTERLRPFSVTIVQPHSAAPEHPTQVAEDDELFIRKTLAEDFRLGVEMLYKRYYQPLCTHAVKFVGSRETAEDLVSEIFFQFYANRTFLEITSSYRLYLFRTLRNRAYNYLRWDMSRKADLAEARYTPALEENQPDHISQYEELYHDVEEAINKLPLERRKIYLMRKFEGKRYQEIAGELQLSVKTVDVQLTRANQHIRSLLKEKWLLMILIVLTTLSA
ncbi:RNA polymerase sigma-70 factor [Telluribacter sp.]|jgi:RNA polymerase sigma-70 factor (ECF subfamily)|uniref:RNA polymerase sigma-70 factor n=1 Tax=Telluribacter sp. TaxID=1978767 RepID=UPI002E130E28|nr:RNA polymerase sigma-70 factor [Telluribacter sp.]